MEPMRPERSTGRARGRRRDPGIDALVLETTRQVLLEVGFASTTVQEISRRSGIHPPTIYRRWPTRIALIRDAAFAGMTEIDVEPTGDLAADLWKYVRQCERALASPAGRIALPGLLAAYEPGSNPSPELWAHVSGREPFLAILRAAPDQVDPTLDPDHIFDVATALLVGSVAFPGTAKRRRSAKATADLIVRMLRPDPS